MEACWEALSTEKLQDLKEHEEELLPHPSPSLVAFSTIFCCECIDSPARG
jgi:hypothetical protein